MLFWLGLVAGLIIGWVIEWIIDWRYWRSNLYASLQQEQLWQAELNAARQEISRLQAQLAELTWPAKEVTEEVVQRDPLEQIQGVGPVYAQRLHDAGIFTFAQLATAAAETLRAAVDPNGEQQVEVDEWIAQAHALTTNTEPASE
jgi:predicted flap endonuclease-1-like 5' DNA nuclease